MNQILCYSIIISSMLFINGCSKSDIISVLDDICRDTYEKNLRKKRNENIGEPNYEEPLTYDQYQRRRKELISKNQAAIPVVEMKK